MSAMPRTSNKARDIAYNLLGCPPCLEEENSLTVGKKKKKDSIQPVESSDFKLDTTLNSR